MKKNYPILLLILFLVTQGWATTDTDSLAVGKRKRTFANAPAVAANVVEVKKAVHPPVTSTVGISTRSFEALDAQIAKNYGARIKERNPEFTEAYLDLFKRQLQDSTASVEEHLAKAVGTFEALDESGNFVETLGPSDLVELPVGIRKTIGNTQYIVGISNASFTPEYTSLTAFVRIILPQQGADGHQKELFFGANDIQLSHEGGLLGDTQLVLLGDFAIAISGGNGAIVLKGGFNLETGDINEDEMTYVTIDCDGFKELSLQAEIQFSRELVVPLNPDYTVDDSFYPGTNVQKRVGAEFGLIASDWNDILVEISLPRFALNDWQEGLVFEINTAVFDFSDLRNDDDVQWPPNYEQEYLDQEFPELWKGVYINSLTIALPEQFKRKGSTERITLNATNMLIDGMGVSGDFSVDNILPLDEGEASAWQFSVDHIEVSFIANTFTKAEFRGGVVLPISKTADPLDAAAQQEASNNPNAQSPPEGNVALAYDALINPLTDEYILTASPTDDIRFDLWKATATIEDNSYVVFTVGEGKFKPEAMLHGSMGIYADNSDPPGNEQNTGNTQQDSSDKKTVEFRGIVFQSLHLKTEAPIFSVGYLGYQGEVKVANFPISIANIGLTTTNTTASLQFDLSINLQSDAFGATTTLAINGSFDEQEGLTKWKYENISFSAISIEADIGGAEFSGSIILMDNDPVYGDGFQGNLMAKFKGLGSAALEIEANAIFGKTEFRYWYVDVMVDNINIPSGPGLSIKGFGGGAFYRMKKVGFSSSFTASGSEYAPDLDSGLGIKAMVLFAATGNEKTFNGGAGFEIAFNSSGGLNRVSIYGEGHVMQDFQFGDPAAKIKGTLQDIVETEAGFSDDLLEELKQTNLVEVSKQVYPDHVSGEVGLNAFAAIEYDFTTQTLHGTFDLYVDVAGGIFRGRASGNRAGWAVLHFEPGSWYIHMGTPTDRLGLEFGIGSVSIETGGYFMIGDQIPASPPPPNIVAEILGVDAEVLDYMRDENALGDGRGLAFGTDFSIDTGDITFLIFYASLQAGVGFDIMVKDYGNTECQGSGQIGINGWYANGQGYAYLQGELGINVKLLFIRKKVPIISAGLAVLIQAKLPNPIWLRGYAGGHFNILGGLIKGRFRMKVEFGEECEIVGGGPLEGLKIIADIQPSDNGSDVDVFTVPQVGFNMRVNHEFELETDDGVSTYRIKLKEFEFTEAGVQLPGNLEWNENGDLLTYTTEDVLPPETPLQLKVSVNFEERVNGVWQVLYDEGQEAIETEIRNFTTGVAPDYIPISNIAYCYPSIDQKYVHKDEHGQAFVKLIQGQDYLFEDNDGFITKSYFITDQGTAESTIGYNNGENKVLVNLPNMGNNLEYIMTLVTEPDIAPSEATLETTYINEDLDEDSNVEVKSVSLGEAVINAEAVEMLSYGFRTSQYSTFGDKINAKAYTQPLVQIIYSDVHALQTVTVPTEPFGTADIVGNEWTGDEPYMRMEAVLTDAYFANEINPLIYADYPINNFTVDRDVSILGIPPVRAMDLMTWYAHYAENDPNYNLLRERMPFRYHLPLTYKEDFIDIQYKIVNAYLNNPELYAEQIAQYSYIINGIFPYIKQGDYVTMATYTLPDGTVTSSTDYTYNKPN